MFRSPRYYVKSAQQKLKIKTVTCKCILVFRVVDLNLDVKLKMLSDINKMLLSEKNKDHHALHNLLVVS